MAAATTGKIGARAMRSASIQVVGKPSWLQAHGLPILASALVCGLIVYVGDRRTPMTLSDPVVSGTAHPGDHIKVDWIQDWKRSCPGTVVRELETPHGEIRSFRPFDIFPPTDLGKINRVAPVWVPKTAAEGTAILRSTIYFRCNFVQAFWPIKVSAPPVSIVID